MATIQVAGRVRPSDWSFCSLCAHERVVGRVGNAYTDRTGEGILPFCEICLRRDMPTQSATQSYIDFLLNICNRLCGSVILGRVSRVSLLLISIA